MKKTLVYDWNREKIYLPTEKPGVFNYHLVYLCKIRDNLIVNVWRVGYSWRYAVIGFAEDMPLSPLILRYGSGPTKNECQYRAEAVLAAEGIRNAQVWESKGQGLDDNLSPLPF